MSPDHLSDGRRYLMRGHQLGLSVGTPVFASLRSADGLAPSLGRGERVQTEIGSNSRQMVT